MDEPVKRGRGRPRKEKVDKPAGKRGRPSKQDIALREHQKMLRGAPPSAEAQIDEETDAWLRAENVVAVINANLPKGAAQLPAIPKDYVFKRRDRKDLELAAHAAFELTGGVANLILWGRQNPNLFYPLIFKLMPGQAEVAQANTAIYVNTSVGNSPLDNVTIDKSGNVINIGEIEDADFEDLP